MRMLLNTAGLFVLALLVGARASAGDGPDPSTAKARALAEAGIAQGDTFVFLGDSITFGCGWTEHVENYFYTRFPQTKIRFVNAAVGGDRSWTVEERFDQSVAPLKPQFATIMLGMNDGRYRAYDPALYEKYTASMTVLLDRLAKMGTKVVIMGPSHFDRRTRDTVRPEPPNNYNGVLELYGSWLRETAWQRKLDFVDVNAAMSRLLVRRRKSNPAFKLTADGIHTDATGDIVIAATLLDAMGMPAEVSAIHVTRTQDGWTHEARGGNLTELEAVGSRVQFTFHADALPWVVGDEARRGYELTSAGEKLNRERLRISGLPPGRYELRIDGQHVGTYTSSDFGIGVELQDNPKTPQHQQAVRMAELNRRRNNFMRSYAKGWFLWALRAPERSWMNDHQPGDDRYDEFNGRIQQSEAALKSTPELLRRADEMIPQVYEAARPEPHVYEIAPAKD